MPCTNWPNEADEIQFRHKSLRVLRQLDQNFGSGVRDLLAPVSSLGQFLRESSDKRETRYLFQELRWSGGRFCFDGVQKVGNGPFAHRQQSRLRLLRLIAR